MQSRIEHLGRVEFPRFSGARVQMMPFLVHDVLGSMPAHLAGWAPLVEAVCARAGERGVGYLTIDEAIVARGEHHRRPGLHVDCGGPTMDHGGSPPAPPKHGGSPAPSPGHGASGARGGMFVVASSLGSRGWLQDIDGEQGDDGDCSHLAPLLGVPLELGASELFWCNSTFVHETLPVKITGERQFLRVSMPSSAPWHADYTPNPLGVLPGGPIASRRVAQMAFRQ